MKEKEIAESRIGLHRLCAMRSRLVVARLHDRREPKRQMRVKDYGVEWAKPQRAVGGGDRLDWAGSEAVHGRAKIKRRGARRIQRQGAFDGAQRRPSFPRQRVMTKAATASAVASSVSLAVTTCACRSAAVLSASPKPSLPKKISWQ